MVFKGGEDMIDRKIFILSRILFLLLFISCGSSDRSEVDILTPPIVLITKSDTMNIVRDSEGKELILTVVDLVNYKVAFMKTGDTLSAGMEAVPGQ